MTDEAEAEEKLTAIKKLFKKDIDVESDKFKQTIISIMGHMVLISSDDISKAEQEEVEQFTTDFEIGKTKTSSQRLRAVLYRVWEQGEQAYDFPIWYESQMERIINKYKANLD